MIGEPQSTDPRLVTGDAQVDDGLDTGLRPQRLDDFIGQQ